MDNRRSLTTCPSAARGDGDGGPVLLECPVGAGRRNSSACLHQESNCRALLAFDLYFGECGNGDQVHAVRSNISPADRDRLDGLVHRTSPDGLELDRTLLTQHCGESAGNGFRLRVGSDFQHFHHTKCAPSTAATIAPTFSLQQASFLNRTTGRDS